MLKVAESEGKYSSFIVEGNKDLFVNFDSKAHIVPLTDEGILLKGLRHPSQSLYYFNEIMLNASARYVKKLNDFRQYIVNVEKVVDGVEVQERKMKQLLVYANSVEVVPVGEAFLKVLTKLVKRSKNPDSDNVRYFKALLENSTVETIMSDFLLEHFFLPIRTHNSVKKGKLFKILSGKFLITVENNKVGLPFDSEQVQNSLTEKVQTMFNPTHVTTLTVPIFVYGMEKYGKFSHVNIHTTKPSTTLTLKNSFTVICLKNVTITTDNVVKKMSEGNIGVFLNGGTITGECVIVEEKP